MSLPEPGRRVLTVSELTRQIQERLESAFGGLWVEGEISNLRAPGSGHVYFTLKDENAQIRAVLFRNRLRRLRFEPQDGLHVLAFGGLEVYGPKGDYQLVCEILEPKGLGALQLAFEQLKARLAAEGLFDPARKRPLPRLSRRIGLITSPTGAAVRDFLQIVRRRFANVHVLIYPVRVQGAEAAGEIVQGIQELNRLGGLDVLVLARGGGSLEDLWAFNEEAVARAIAASKIPVVSAVGHETDVTIADFVADLRAPTPSGAAELVVQEKAALLARLADLAARLRRALDQRVRRLGERLDELARRRVLTDPGRPLREAERRLDELAARLRRGFALGHRSARQRYLRAKNALRPGVPLANMAHGAKVLDQLHRRLGRAASGSLEGRRGAIGALAARLEGLSPLAVLARGYSLCTLPSGELVVRARQVGPGERVRVRLSEGELGCRVEEVREPDGQADA
ncbi:MAG: exodeoxyribonuclease VII large subunit [Candidatus Rokubacteria bacterium]|nr:exodeoxyribonuclease VII large subunit [Candidatus Rokubacteria bacterium]